MPEMNSPAEGAPCWFELGTTDQKSGNQFYTTLFGWSVTDTPIGQDQFYSMYRKDGKEVGAAYTLSKDMQEQGVPPHWMVYFATHEIDTLVAKVADLGGMIIQPAFDVMDYGRMAVVRDPTAALFSLWQPKQHRGVGVYGDMNTVCWTELATRDPAEAKRFYSELLGWETKPSPAPVPYTQFAAGGRESGGILQIDDGWGDMKPYWSIYYRVDDCDGMAEKIKAHGGQVKHGPFDAPGVGRIAIVADPQGAIFQIIRLDM